MVLKHLRLTFFVILIFQLSVGNVIAAAGGDGSKVSPNAYSNDSKYALQMLQAADQIESGTFFNKDPRQFDIFRLLGQRVEIYNKDKIIAQYSLNDPRIEKTALSYTNLRPKYDAQKKELVFEATRGSRPDGTGGTIVAKHIISDVDMISMTADREMLTFLDSKGNLHAIDMGYVITQVFTNPIPTFRNLWESGRQLENVEMSYITRGVRPVDNNVNMTETVVPLNKNGEMEFTAGDLLIRYKDGNSEKVLGVFSRKETYRRIQEGEALLSILGSLITPDQDVAEYFNKNLDKLEKTAQAKADSLKVSMNISSPLQNIDQNQLETLVNRITSLGNYSQNRVDKFTHEEWKQDHQILTQNASDPEKLKNLAKNSKLMQEKAVGEDHQKIYRTGYAQVLGDEEAHKRLERPEVLAKSWQVLLEPQARANPFDKNHDVKKVKEVPSERKSEWKLAGYVIGGLAAYLSGAILIPNIDVLHQIQAISWIYDHIYFDVLKDLAYRYPLSASIISWMGVWPAALGLSFGFEKVLKMVGAMTKNSNSAFANSIRDMQATWLPMTDWQRVVTVGMRAYSIPIYPYMRALVEGSLLNLGIGLRQKAFFSAYGNGINPLKLVKKDSDLGKQFNLQKNEYLGLNNPFLNKDKMAETVNKKMQMQSALAQQKRRIESLSVVLATLVVANKSGIDMATLLQASQQKVTGEQLQSVLNDPDKQREWELLISEMQNDLQSRNVLTLGQEVKDLSPEELKKLVEETQKVADKINSNSAFKQKAALRLKALKKAPVNAANFMLFENGRADAIFLKNLVANSYVSSQVKQEFRGDHIQVVTIPSFIGAQADLADPANLAADANGFLWTSHVQSYSLVTNTWAHFFAAGASLALVFQKLRAEQETNYLPKEDFTLTSDIREESVGTGFKNWFAFGYNQRTDQPKGILKKGVHYMYNFATEGNIGGIMAKRVGKRFTTLQAGITMAIVFRSIIGHQDIGTAMAAWALMFMSAQWYYGWVWDPVQRGNQMTGDRIEKLDLELKETRSELSQALRSSDLPRSQAAYKKMIDLFEKNNPAAVSKLKEVLESNIERINPGKSNLNGTEKEYLGLVARLAEAANSKDQEKFDQTINLLRKVLVEKQGYDADDVAKLNSQSILEFSLANPPTYTHANQFVVNFFSLNGAVWSTVLAIPLTVMLFNANALGLPNLAKWFAISSGLYVTSYLLFGRTPWLYYEKVYNKVKAKLVGTKDTSEKTDTIKAEAAKAPLVLAPSHYVCSSLFSGR